MHITGGDFLGKPH